MEGVGPQRSVPGLSTRVGRVPAAYRTAHPIPTTEFPKARSAEDHGGPGKGPPGFDMLTSRGGYPFPVTPREGRLPVYERTPECVKG